jgi:FG-GAP-like repeat
MSKPNYWLILFFLCIAEMVSAQFGPQQPLHSCLCNLSNPSVDLDGDRFPDLITYENFSSNLAWLKNDGKGGISKQFSIAPELRSKGTVFAADIDADQDNDILTVLENNDVVCLKNNGKGEFLAPQRITTLSNNNYLLSKLLDLDLDKDPDLIIFSERDNTIAWLRNDGKGQFTSSIIISRVSYGVTDVQVADVDADQDLDIVSANTTTVSWYINQGKENFTTTTPFAIEGANPVKNIFVFDFDNDKDLDVIGYGYNSWDMPLTLNIYRKNSPILGDYTLQRQTISSTRFLYLVDLDKNNEMEFLGTNNQGNGLLLRRRNEVGSYGNILPILGAEYNVNTLITTDWDQDGDMDILINGVGPKIDWLENRGENVFVQKTAYEAQLDGLANVQIFDLDGDGDNDILAASDNDDRIAWYPNEGAGKFGVLKTITTKADSATFVFAVDLDRDQKLDVISSSWKDGKIAWYKNLGSGVFSAQQIISDSARSASAVYAADLDQDGAMDILAASRSKLAWFKRKSDGSFQEFLIFRDIPNLPGNTSRQMYPAILAADFDNDGDMDVIASSYTKGSIQWFRNEGKGIFSQKPLNVNPSSNYAFWGLAVADLDGDKDLDVLSASLNDEVIWFRNDSLGKYFQPLILTTKADGANYVKAGDIDGDGDLDIVAASAYDNKIAWFENKGQGQFSDEKIISLKQHWLLNGLDLADLDADGDLDLASCSQFDDKVAWFENRFNYASISGYVFWDENGNKRFDPGEKPLPNYPITLNPSAEATFSSNDGRFRFFTGAGRYQLKANLDSCWQLTTDSTTYTVNVGGQVANNLNFGFRLNNEAQRVSVRLNSGPTRCGFEVPFWLSIHNAACAPSKGKFGVVFSKLTTFRSASQFPQSMSGDTMWWNYSDLVGSSTQQIQLILQVAGTNFIGDTINMKGVAYLENARGKLELASTFEFKSEIRCAYDPNDKQTFPNRTDEYPQNYTLFKENLEYLIRFQNVGNDTAFTVTIRDTLDASLDWKTFKPLQGSHLYSSNIAPNGAVTFTFSQILLPPSSSNEPLSHGFVRYRIASKTGLPEETAIKNTAHIYFDFNPAIVTNTTNNLMVSKLPGKVNNASKGKLFNIYPNPFTRYFQVESLEQLVIGGQYTFYLYNGNAQLLQSQAIDEQVERIKTGTLPVGLYFYLIKDAQGRIVDSGKVVCR